MRSSRLHSLIASITLLLLLLFLACGTAFSQTGYDVVLRGGRVIDPETSLDAFAMSGFAGTR